MSLDLNAIKARIDAATTGPWTAHPDGLVWPERPGDPVSGSSEQEDAEFIAHAREDIQVLLLEVGRLFAVERRLRAEVDRLRAASEEQR